MTLIRKIKRKRKHLHGDSSKLRERNACPICNSLEVMKRVRKQEYNCHNCRWRGKSIIKVMA